MKVILQHLSDGTTELIEAPVPVARSGGPRVLIRNTHSLISIGTERMLLDFGRGNLLSKARQQPEKVKAVVEKAATDGVVSTLEAVKGKLAKPIQLGYCASGVVVEPGDSEFHLGQRVVSNGYHAEMVSVSRNLVAAVPDAVDSKQACFTPAAAIALQGIRLAEPTLGETFVVSGLGLIGQLAVQLLLAQGCQVIGTDFDEKKVDLARSFGATGLVLSKDSNPTELVAAIVGAEQIDGVLITASTSSSDPVRDAAQMCRKRGRIVLVGVTGLNLRRDDFYKKEISFQVSCSYGPGRYDPFHEDQGHDYPIGFVRWTEKRNFEAVLGLMAAGKLDPEPLITEMYDFQQAVQAYDSVVENPGAMGIVLEYTANVETGNNITLAKNHDDKSTTTDSVKNSSEIVVSCIGAGNYATRILLPAFKNAGVKFETIVSEGGVNGADTGRNLGFDQASTETSQAVGGNCDVVVVATRHDSHAELVISALASGKQVFVEKPLALTLTQLEDIENAARDFDLVDSPIMVGFNRRYAPLVQSMYHLLDKVNEPKCFNITVNAGYIPADSWIQSRSQGGGRIIGEACHWIDLLRFLARSTIVDVGGWGMGHSTAIETREDKAIINLRFADGSIGCINYFANGGKRFPKERIEVFAGNAALQIDNFRVLRGYGWKGFKNKRMYRQEKGQFSCVQAYVDSVRSGNGSPITLNEILEVSRAAIEADAQISNMT